MTLLAAAACSGDEPRSATGSDEPPVSVEAEAASEAISNLHLYVLDCGLIDISDLDAFSSAGDYAGLTDTFGDACFLIRHPNGDLLWDLGLPTGLAGAGPQENGIFTVSLDFTLTEQLIELGLAPADIEYISISHSHFDHSGQVDQFQASTWLVHSDEYATMFPSEAEMTDTTEGDESDAGSADPFVDFTNLNTELFDGEKDVFGDGSVTIIPMPGHTPGHTVLRVNLPETGPLLLTGDLYHRQESRDLRRVPRFNADEPQTLASMDAFEALARETGAKVVIQHDLDSLSELPRSPEPLR